MGVWFFSKLIFNLFNFNIQLDSIYSFFFPITCNKSIIKRFKCKKKKNYVEIAIQESCWHTDNIETTILMFTFHMSFFIHQTDVWSMQVPQASQMKTKEHRLRILNEKMPKTQVPQVPIYLYLS